MDEQTRLDIEREHLEKMQWNSCKLDELVDQGLISHNLGEYAHRLMDLDFTTWVAEAYARQGALHEAANSLMDGKLILDNIALICLHLREMEIYKNSPILATLVTAKLILPGLIPDRKRALYAEAKHRYDAAFIMVEKTLEGLE